MKADTWAPSGVESLEPAAWAALRHPDNASVVAGPGAGKTEFLAQRACYLLDTGECPPPQRILAISYKRDAAANLAKRVQARARADVSARFDSVTFDSFTKGIVDRFRRALPPAWRVPQGYEIEFLDRRTIPSLLDNVGESSRWPHEVAALRRDSFESAAVGGWRLPPEPQEPTSGLEEALYAYWKRLLGSPRLTFVALNRLAELILRHNPDVARALQLTYPCVFIDEFQDTTFAQYDFLRSVFSADRACVTAVGDGKQRIMGWAGAIGSAFDQFDLDFSASRFDLLMNFRSSPCLVRLQHVVARALDADTPASTSAHVDEDDEACAEIWRFDDAASEARKIAQWIDQKLAADPKLRPADFAILTRQTPERFAGGLTAALDDVGVKLRNDSERIGKTTLQDLLVEEISMLVLAFLELGALDRAPRAWASAHKLVGVVRAVDPEDEAAGFAVGREIERLVAELRLLMAPAPALGPLKEVLNQIFDFLDLALVRGTFPSYRTGDDLQIAIDAMSLRLLDKLSGAASWADLCEAYQAKDAVALLTVHKSKGLEYKHVVFLGIDDNLWWSHEPGEPEGVSTFFVGLSRARLSATFTFCEARGARDRVADLYGLLAEAGVTEHSY
jgi:superfamily I DNA/RNA helicase